MPPVRKQVAVFMSNTPLPPHISLTPPPLQPQKLWLFHHRSVEQWGMQPAACAHFSFSLAFIRLHPSTGCSLTHTLASHVSCLIPSTPLSLSPGGGHQQTRAICLHVMEVWGCGARLVPSRPSGEGQPRQMLKHSRQCVRESVCVLEQAQLCHTLSVLD